MKSVMATILGLLLVILGVYSIFYLILSSASPHLLSVLLVTGLLGAFVSLTSSLVFAHFFARYLGGQNHTPPATGSDPHTTVDRGHRVSGVSPVMWPIVLSVFFILSAVVTHALNTPRPISRELHLTYLLNPQTGEFVTSAPFVGGSFCASDAEALFREYKETHPEHAKLMEDMATINPQPESWVFAQEFFQNLTVFLIPYCLARPTSEGLELKRYDEEEARAWIGNPSRRIWDGRHPVEFIGGEFNQNLFYEIAVNESAKERAGLGLRRRPGLALPRGAKMYLAPVDSRRGISRLIVENAFLTMKFGIQTVQLGNVARGMVESSVWLN